MSKLYQRASKPTQAEPISSGPQKQNLAASSPLAAGATASASSKLMEFRRMAEHNSHVRQLKAFQAAADAMVYRRAAEGRLRARDVAIPVQETPLTQPEMADLQSHL